MFRLDLENNPAYQAVDALRGTFGDRLVAVVLFGSRARGDARETSDWDLLVIAEELPENLFERHLFLTRLLPSRCQGSVSIIARTPAEFESHVPSLYLDIALDGQILYDPHRYAAKRLARLRGLIERMGLFRERTEAGDVWQWREGPTGPWELGWEE